MNRLRIIRNIIGKLACFAYFGLSSIFVSLIVFPLVHLFVWDEKKRRNIKINIVRKSFLFFIFLLFWWAKYKIDISAMQEYKHLSSTIIVANHPSLIDIVILICASPRPDCIVAGRLFENFWIKRIVDQLFISSSENPEILLERCKKSLHDGNNMIIFPEGTRTKLNCIGKPDIKRGAAQIALRAQADILPIHIKTENYVGLGKNESLFKVHVKGYAKLTLEPKPLIAMAKVSEDVFSKAARTLTDTIRNTIFEEGMHG